MSRHAPAAGAMMHPPDVPSTPHCFAMQQRVYYQHTDAGGMVYHGRYLDFMEAARTEFLQLQGHDLAELARGSSVMFVVRDLRVDYLRPALLQDLLTITAEVVKVGFASLRFVQRVLRAPQATAARAPEGPSATNAELLVRADVDLACVDPRSVKPARLPADMRRSLAALAASVAAPPIPPRSQGEA